MRVWHFWHEFVTCVCPICVYASRVQIWKQSLSFSLSFLLLLLSVMNRSRRFTIFLASSTFPFMNSICIPFGDRKRLRFDMPRGVEKKKPALWICIHGCIKVSFSPPLFDDGGGLFLFLSFKSVPLPLLLLPPPPSALLGR